MREGFREEELLFDLKSDIKVPIAEGGGFGVGAATSSGLGLSAKALLFEGVGRLVI